MHTQLRMQKTIHMLLSEGHNVPHSRGYEYRKSDQHRMSLWLADKASGRPPTQTPHINLKRNRFLLESRVGRETAPHLASRQLKNLLKARIEFDEHHVCRREQWSSMCLPAGAADQLLGARPFRIEPVGASKYSACHDGLVVDGMSDSRSPMASGVMVRFVVRLTKRSVR